MANQLYFRMKKRIRSRENKKEEGFKGKLLRLVLGQNQRILPNRENLHPFQLWGMPKGNPFGNHRRGYGFLPFVPRILQ